MSLIRKYLEEKKACTSKMAEAKEKDDEKENEKDEVETSDYKLDKHGKKYKAHKIVFNKGEDDGKNIGEELKGNQHKLDKNKNGKLDAHDFKLLRKEESEEVSEEMTAAQMKKREEYVKGMKKSYKGFVDKYGKDRAKSVMYATATKMAMKEDKEEQSMEEGWDDMMKAAKERGASIASKTSTKTYHDVKKTSTGTVYTKQHDKDGMSKGTGAPSPEQKRGRGRPRKDKFAEAVEFLMDLTEEQFDFVVEEGFDSFFESFLDESAKGYAPGWMIKASPELKKKIDAIKAKHAAMRKAMGNPAAGKSVDNK